MSNDAIRKIEKCLALSKSSNEHEAAAALRQANKLMAAYNITPEALQASTIGAAQAKTDSWTRPPAWEMQLLRTINKAFACQAVLNMGCGVFKRLTLITYIGVKHQAELAAYTHEVIRRQVVNARSKFVAELGGTRGQKMAAGETFCQAYVESINAQIVALANTPEQDAAITDRKQQLLGNSGNTYKAAQRGWDGAAHAAGSAAAKGASLHRPMHGKQALRLE